MTSSNKERLMHILFLTDNFPPEVNAPASRTFEHCREWVKAGHRVTIITCAPNFPKGAVFEGYRNKLWQTEEIAGIRVIRVWSYITANDGLVKRILDYVSFMMSAIAASLFVRKVDVVIGTSPQFFTACAAYVVGGFKRVPWVFELRDIWPESIRAVGAMKQSAALDYLEKLELFLYRKATVIVSVTNSFRENLVSRGIDRGKIRIVTNGVDTGRFTPREKDKDLVSRLDIEDKFVAGYIGTHGMAHALDTVLDAAKIIAERPDGDRYRFLFLGDGSNNATLVNRAKEEEITNVIFVDSVSKDDVVRYWSLLDTSIIHLKDTDLFKAVIPSKIFECMAMAIPVLHGVKGESAEIIESQEVGVLFEPQNAQALVGALLSMRNDEPTYQRFKENGPVAAKKYNRTNLANNMLEILSEVVAKAK